jgi:acyl-CoA thioester hydrolase
MTSPPPRPLAGRFLGREHHFPVHIYFEDTDFSGLVYHANYLRYMERARSDMLACVGIDQRAAFADDQGVYAVSELAIKYRRPARFDDELTVVSSVERLGAATCVIHQRVMLGDETLTNAQVTAAFLSRDGRPRRQPKPWIDAFKPLLPEETTD